MTAVMFVLTTLIGPFIGVAFIYMSIVTYAYFADKNEERKFKKRMQYRFKPKDRV